MVDYVLCGAHKAILFAIYLRHLGKKITVITNNEDIVKYCDLENIDYIRFENVRFNISSIHKIFSHKKMLNGLIEKINLGKEDRFFLPGSKFKGFSGYYLAKELAKKGVVYYKDPHDRQFDFYKPPWFKPIFLRGAIIRLALKLVMGLDLIYYEYNNIPCLGINDSYLKKNNILTYLPDQPTNELILDAIKNYKSSYNECNNLIIDGGEIDCNIITFDSIMKIHERLLELPLEYVFKKHPKVTKNIQLSKSLRDYYNLFRDCEEIPRYIPVELFCNNVNNFVITICSVSSISTSQLKHSKTVSLLELVDWYDQAYKNNWKEYMIKLSKNKILFPNTFEELKEILLKDK